MIQRPQPMPPEVGSTVKTPSGRPAIVIELHLPEREATVQWIEDGERARFKWGVLR
jgi:hypothetical protein